MLDIGSVLRQTSALFQRERLTTGQCKDELMLAIGQFSLLLKRQRQSRPLNACNMFLMFDPSTWPKEKQDVHGFGNTDIIQKYKACLSASSVNGLLSIANTDSPIRISAEIISVYQLWSGVSKPTAETLSTSAYQKVRTGEIHSRSEDDMDSLVSTNSFLLVFIRVLKQTIMSTPAYKHALHVQY